MSQHDDEEEDRRAILGRKAMFIASAMSGMALLDGCARPRPEPCLSVIPNAAPDVTAPPDATVLLVPEAGLPEPTPCLSVAIPEDATEVLAPVAEMPSPMPCLSMVAPRDAGARRDEGRPPRRRPDPTPMACLSVAPPEPCLSVLAPQQMPMVRKPEVG
jgi:hypothetical protein